MSVQNHNEINENFFFTQKKYVAVLVWQGEVQLTLKKFFSTAFLIPHITVLPPPQPLNVGSWSPPSCLTLMLQADKIKAQMKLPDH